MSKNQRRKEIAMETYDSIIRYIGKVKDKNAKFSTKILDRCGEHGYNRYGFSGLVSNGVIIKRPEKDYTKNNLPVNVYNLSSDILDMSLGDILNLSYHKALRINTKS